MMACRRQRQLLAGVGPTSAPSTASPPADPGRVLLQDIHVAAGGWHFYERFTRRGGWARARRGGPDRYEQ